MDSANLIPAGERVGTDNDPNDPSKYQKSFPTPKNTTPLGYHRKKQITGKQPFFMSQLASDDKPSGALILSQLSSVNMENKSMASKERSVDIPTFNH